MLKFSSLQRFGIALVSAALVYAGPPAGVGYLARIGPTAIRFRSIAPPRDPAQVLPPLKTTDEGSETPIEMPQEGDESSSDAESSATEGGLSFVGPPIPSGDVTVTNAPPVPQTMVPQMLVRYFGSGTNNEAFISMPVEFTPPGPPFSRGSSATYISR